MSEAEKTSKPERSSLRGAMGEASRLVRPLAVLAWVAVLFAEGLSPATKLFGQRYAWLINGTDIVSGTFSHMLSLSAAAFSIGLLTLLLRDRGIPLIVRILLLLQTAWVLLISIPATRFTLSTLWLFVLGLDVALVAIVGGLYALKMARTRAVGFMLTLMGTAALLRLPGLTAMAMAGPSDGLSMTKLAMWLSTLSFILYVLALLVAMVWIATRNRRRMISVSTVVVMALAVVGIWIARAAQVPGHAPWMSFVVAGIDGITVPPTSIFSHLADQFVALLGLLLGGIALLRRNEIAAVGGAVALTMTAGVGVDFPARGLILLVASLSAVLASRDDHGMWEALLGKRLERGTPPPETSKDTSTDDDKQPDSD